MSADWLAIVITITINKLSPVVVIGTSAPRLEESKQQFALEETFKSHVVQTPCNDQGQLQLDQVAQNSSSLAFPGMVHLQSLGNIFQCFTKLTIKNFLLMSKSESTLPYFQTITPCPIAKTLLQSL